MFTPDLESTGDSTLVGIWYALRPYQWYKQLIIIIPIVYAGKATEFDAWIYTVVGVLVFSLVAGCVYIINDILDRENDRNHPVKRHRPIASGQVPVRVAMLVAISGFLVSGAIALWLSTLFFTILFFYVVQNIAYSTVLKHVFLVDIFVVGTGFVLRATAGVVLIGAPLSPWLFLTVFLAAFLLASGKRRAELVRNETDSVRTSLDNSTPEFSLFLLFLSAATLLVVYSLYTFFAGNTEMMITIPFAYYSVLRFCHSILGRPTEQVQKILFQKDMVLNFSLWGVVTLIILYHPGSV